MTSKTQLRLATLLSLVTGVAFSACSSTSATKNVGSGSGGGTSTSTVGTTVGSDGSTVTMGSDGSTVTTGSDGSTVTTGTDGTVTSSTTTNGGTTVTTGGTTGGTTATTTGGAATTSAGGAGTTDGGTSMGGAATVTTDGGTTGGETTTGGGGPAPSDGPCDVYAAGGQDCVAAYSMVRRLSSAYSGPLYQVRSGSNNMNTGSGGELHDIGMTEDGFADAAAQDSVCEGTTCTVSLLYDQSGNGNDLPVAKRGLSNGGDYAAMDDFESLANRGPLTVNGHNVYSLYTEARQGYRLAAQGQGMPRGTAAQGIYMLADGTHSGTACCWDFGNVSTDPTAYHVMNTLFFGVAFWGRGAGSGPWFMADYEAGVWAGGSNAGDPGWGALNEDAPPNNDNPSLAVKFALGFLKTDPQNWGLRMADVQTASTVTTAYQGALPKAMDNQGGIVLGVGGDNSNNSWGTFYEGAIVSGFPADDTEQAVLENIQAVGYGQ